MECIKKVLTSYSEYGSSVTFSGGEITNEKDLYDIVAFASNECKLNVRLMTNDVLWDESMIDKFSPIINSVQISIDGYSEESNALVERETLRKRLILLLGLQAMGYILRLQLLPLFQWLLIMKKISMWNFVRSYSRFFHIIILVSSFLSRSSTKESI